MELQRSNLRRQLFGKGQHPEGTGAGSGSGDKGDEAFVLKTCSLPVDGCLGELGVLLELIEADGLLLRPAGLVEDVHQAIPEGDRARSHAALRQQLVEAVDFCDVVHLVLYF